MASWRSEALLDVLSQEQTRDIGGSAPGALKALFDVLSQEQTKEITDTPRPPSAATTTKPARVHRRSR